MLEYNGNASGRIRQRGSGIGGSPQYTEAYLFIEAAILPPTPSLPRESSLMRRRVREFGIASVNFAFYYTLGGIKPRFPPTAISALGLLLGD